jgi:toxin ParE1/3/4
MKQKNSLTLEIKPKAKKDLLEIYEYTKINWSAKQADDYIQSIDNAFKLLSKQPDFMPVIKHGSYKVRAYIVKKHVVLYNFTGNRLVIIRVMHSSQNWYSLL